MRHAGTTVASRGRPSAAPRAAGRMRGWPKDTLTGRQPGEAPRRFWGGGRSRACCTRSPGASSRHKGVIVAQQGGAQRKFGVTPASQKHVKHTCPAGHPMPSPHTGKSLQSARNGMPTQAAFPPGVFPQKHESSGPHSGSAGPSGGHWNGALHDATQAWLMHCRLLGQQRPSQNSRFFRLHRFRLETFAASVPASAETAASEPPKNPPSTNRRVSRSNRVASTAFLPIVVLASFSFVFITADRDACSGRQAVGSGSRTRRRSARVDKDRSRRMPRGCCTARGLRRRTRTSH